MFENYDYTVTNRFLQYVQIDTQSNAASSTNPTTEKQKNLSTLLVQQLHNIGVTNAYTNQYGYVYASIPSNSQKQVPTICFCSHIDTTDDCSGTNVQPLLHKHYNGQDIFYPNAPDLVLSATKYPYLLQHVGHTIITASGTTLLGADDKAGVAIIMDMANYLMHNTQIKHGTISILFTPDEEVGRGTDKIDMKAVNAQYGYTLDGGEAGNLEQETFSANALTLTVHGKIAHPGDAKGKMINALKLAAQVLTALPTTILSPESTTDKQGFVHPLHIAGTAEEATIQFIIRDFVTSNLQAHQQVIEDIAKQVTLLHKGSSYSIAVTKQYRNMYDIIQTCPQVVTYAQQAIQRTGLTPMLSSIRGGTDGSKLSYLNLPCPNIYTGMQNIHSPLEWIGERDMQLAVQTLVHLCCIWEEESN